MHSNTWLTKHTFFLVYPEMLRELTASVCVPGSMGLRLHCHSARPQPAAEGEGEDLEVPQVHWAVWLFPNGFTTWLPVMLTSPTTSCGAMNTGRRQTDWPLIAKVGPQTRDVFYIIRCYHFKVKFHVFIKKKIELDWIAWKLFEFLSLIRLLLNRKADMFCLVQ